MIDAFSHIRYLSRLSERSTKTSAAESNATDRSEQQQQCRLIKQIVMNILRFLIKLICAS